MNEVTTTASAKVAEYLEGAGVAFQILEHPHTSSAFADGRATHHLPHSVGKTVVLRDQAGYVLAVVPASERLDLRKLRDALGATRKLQLVDEAEMGHEFPDFDVGAIPPVGAALPFAEVVDRQLLEEDRIVCASGDHMHSIVIDPRDLVAVAGAKVADICQD